ncbi:MAG: hypothetical protein JW782_07210 [Candidatus Saganbacteria bacterium]|nr:hypothetical protein [Candidatus Saganbacteria bacterium]
MIFMLLAAGLCATTCEAVTACSTLEKPDISVLIDGVKPYPGDPISSTPRIEITATTSNAVVSGTIRISSLQASLTFARSNNTYRATYEVTTALSDGRYAITIEATDDFNNTKTYEVIPVYVQAGESATIQGFALSHPNPFDPGSQNVAIGYTLSKPADIKLNIFDLAGNLVKVQDYLPDSAGGRAGYNEITWDGKDASGNYAGNGIYIFLLTSGGSVLQNGKGKITVFKR